MEPLSYGSLLTVGAWRQRINEVASEYPQEAVNELLNIINMFSGGSNSASPAHVLLEAHRRNISKQALALLQRVCGWQ